MKKIHLENQIEKYITHLCNEIPTRRVGTQGNRDANEYLAKIFSSFGFEIERQPFYCIDWTQGKASLTVDGEQFEVSVGAFSEGCNAQAPLVVVSNVEELEFADAQNKFLLLRGELTREQLMPKNFPFYNPDEHKHIVHLLEAIVRPRAILTATGRNPETAGAVYPFPMIEDGDFNIPSVFMTEEEGERLASYVGREAVLVIEAERIPSNGFNLVARKGHPDRRVVVSAHMDTKDNTPGALDNAASVVVLLLLAELLKGYDGDLGIELVPFNGEDHYSAAGEKVYLKANEDLLDQVLLNINLDALGSFQGNTVYSFYECPDKLKSTIQETFSTKAGFAEGEPWFQSDHMVFVMNGIPALAITSENFLEILTELAHTPEDNIEKVDIGKVAEVAMILHNLLQSLQKELF